MPPSNLPPPPLFFHSLELTIIPIISVQGLYVAMLDSFVCLIRAAEVARFSLWHVCSVLTLSQTLWKSAAPQSQSYQNVSLEGPETGRYVFFFLCLQCQTPDFAGWTNNSQGASRRKQACCTATDVSTYIVNRRRLTQHKCLWVWAW